MRFNLTIKRFVDSYYKYLMIVILSIITICTIYSCIITYDDYEDEIQNYGNNMTSQIHKEGIQDIPLIKYSDDNDSLTISSPMNDDHKDCIENQEFVSCPACCGIGVIVFDPFTRMDCELCKTRGVVSVKLAQEYFKMMQQFNAKGNNTIYYGGEIQSDKKLCPHCNGRKVCPNCAGRGYKNFDIGTETVAGDCRDCNGSGTCQMCFGKGFLY